MTTSLVILQDKPEMTLCSICPSPGSCCKNFILEDDEGRTSFYLDESEEVDAFIADNKLPFIPIGPSEFSYISKGKRYSQWRFSCKNLLPNGRCGDYENRPSVCREYIPASSSLCIFGSFRTKEY